MILMSFVDLLGSIIDMLSPLVVFIAMLSITLLSEYLFARIVGKTKIFAKKSVVVTLAVSALLCAILAIVYSLFFRWSSVVFYIAFATLETVAVFIKAQLFNSLDIVKTKKTSLLFSFLLTAVSSVLCMSIAVLFRVLEVGMI